MSMNTMEYKGYTAVIEYSAEDECLVGHVIGISDRIGFDGESIAEITQHFHDVLDCYLTHCEEVGKIPETPRSGKLLLRLPAELHAFVAQQAETTGESVNGIIVGAVKTLRDRGHRSVARRPVAVKGRGGQRKTRALAGAGK
jgi:predicted HicB family RNase H-like nuclease